MSGYQYADPEVRFRLIAPDEEMGPTAEPLVFDRVENAWRVAAQQVLSAPDEPADADRVTTARDLLDCNEVGVMWGWVVRRWAKTVTHAEIKNGHVSKDWRDGIQLQHASGLLEGTYTTTAVHLLQDLLTDGEVDVVVAAGGDMTIGIAAECTPGGQVTFVDGHIVDLGDTSALIALYR